MCPQGVIECESDSVRLSLLAGIVNYLIIWLLYFGAFEELDLYEIVSCWKY